ncbi:MAG TPA: class I SAM-dependent methyltransferase [Isosphaeraceae bacterium]|jgi:2-polyprenyl-3-methyl-5-hydroxy-6-metoxy-1,4-benzoquinol methylase|nr:class I SAM-dependent methyltransferase [Isosphaeraceae bacterium]
MREESAGQAGDASVTTTVAAHGTACRVCGSGDTVKKKDGELERPLEPKDFQITDDRYGVTLSLWKCRHCHFLFAEGDEIATLTALYERLNDPAYEQSQDTRSLQMSWLLDKALRRRPWASSLLDIGAGAGLLVAQARQRGLEAVGVEPSRSLVEAAQAINGVDLLQGVFPHPELADRRFDIIFLVDVIEHVAEPVELLRDCAQALAPTGILVVVTPDVGSLAARLLGRRWWHFRLAHVGYFNHRSLPKALERAGLRLASTARAKWFFRLSYLAERLERYLPVGWINRLSRKSKLLNRLYELVIPLNLFDSFLVFAETAAKDGAA